MTEKPDQDRPLSTRELVSSIAAAAFGVQSQEKRERDFSRGSARQFVIAGLVGTALFVLLVYAAVRLVLTLAIS